MTIQLDTPAFSSRYSSIDEIIAKVNELRSVSQFTRYNGALPPELPSKEAIKSIIETLISVLYPRHYGPTGITNEKVVDYQRNMLITALGRLQKQIRLEIALSSSSINNDIVHLDIGRRAVEISNELAESLPNIRALLDKDIQAAFDGDPSAKSIDEIIFCFPGVAAVIRHRIAHQLYLSGATMIARIISEISHSETSVDIHPGAEIGEGFFIDHGTGVVIGETSIIGRNVRLYQAVTLGAKRFEKNEDGVLVKGQPRHPIVEDDVVIYAGATVLGRITIGHGSSIGGSVWLTHSVPPRSNVTQAKVHTETFGDGSGI